MSDIGVDLYRGIDGLKIVHVSKANLFTGSNGVGKNAFLEDILLLNILDINTLLWNDNILRIPDPIVDTMSEQSGEFIELYGTE